MVATGTASTIRSSMTNGRAAKPFFNRAWDMPSTPNVSNLRVDIKAMIARARISVYVSVIAKRKSPHAQEIRTLSAHLRADLYREAGAPDPASGRQGPALRQARGLQFGSGIRRQQATQARIHHSRRYRLQCRYAGVDWRRSVEPYPHGGRRCRQDRLQVQAGSGDLGAP